MADSQKVAVAKSIAINGSQGPAMLQAAAQSSPLAAEQGEALKTAAARAGAINAPEAFLRQQAAQIAEPFNTAGTKEASDASALHSYLGSMGGAHSNYLSELAAATPIAQAQVNKANSSQNLNQMMQLLNAQQNAQQWEWQKEDRALKQTTLDQGKTDTATQQAGLNTIVNHPNTYFRQEGSKLLAAGSLPAALGLLSDDAVQKDLIKHGVDTDELRRAIIGYYDPTTAKSLPPRVTPATNTAPVTPGASTPAAKKAGGGLLSFLTNPIGRIGGF